MPVYKEKSGTWRVNYRYTDWTGVSKQSTKRGFATRREALAWERKQSIKLKASLDMSFGSFVELYTADRKCRVRKNTWRSKEHIIRTKILPYFKDRKIGDISSRDVVAWQNELFSARQENDEPYSQNYLKTVHDQLGAIFNHSVKHYGLLKNPAMLAGNMGKEKKVEMQFWTQEEYSRFSEAIMDKPLAYGRVFIYYTVDEITRTMGCCKQKAAKLLKELKGIGLIECKRIGLTKPNRIYIKTFY